jgi:hypothetical protein
MYRETRNQTTGELTGILRLSDGACIPLALGNRDYQEYSAWLEAGNTPDPDPFFTLEAVRIAKWLEIKAQRDTRKAGGVKVGNYWYHSDADSRIQWLGIKDTARDILLAGGNMSSPVPIVGQALIWKTMSGAFIQVTCQVAFDVVQATKGLDATLFASAEAKRAAINATQTPETINTSSGWNQTYEESLVVL